MKCKRIQLRNKYIYKQVLGNIEICLNFSIKFHLMMRFYQIMVIVEVLLMPLKCPPGTSPHYRYKKTKQGKIRLGGCAKKGKFIKGGIKEIKK